MPTEKNPNQTPQDDNAPQIQTGKQKPPPKRRRRRWPFVLVALLLLIVVVIGAAPYAASTRAGTNAILSMVNGRLPGEIKLDKLSLSWFGNCGLDNLSVKDPDGRDVIAVKNVRLEKGIAGLATGYENFNAVTIDAPDVTLYLDEDGNISLVQAFSTGEEKEESGPLPELMGRLTLKDCAVHIIRADGARLDIPHVEADITLSTLAAISGKLLAETADKQAISADFEFQNLLADGTFAPLRATGRYDVHSDGDIAIDSIAAFFSPDSKTTGTINLSAKGTMTAGDIDAQLAFAANDLQSKAAGNMKPVNLSLNGNVKSDGKLYGGNLDLKGDAGRTAITFDYATPKDGAALSADYITAAILTGKHISMPQFNVKGDGEIDLAKIARVLPGLFGMPADQKITGGALKLTSLSATGGDSPAATVNITLEPLTAGSGETQRTVGPASVDVAAKLVQGTGLQIEQATVKTKSTEIVASGSASDMKATITGDLAGLSRELAGVGTELPAGLAGKLAGNVNMKRAGDDRIDLTADFAATKVQMGEGDQRTEIARAALTHTGRLELADGSVKRIIADETKLDLDGKLIATAKGDIAADTGALNAELNLAPTDLAYLGARSPGLGMAGLASYGGRLTMTARATRQTSQKPIQSTGNVTAANVTLDGKPADTGDVKLEWSDVDLDTTGSKLRIGVAKLESALAHGDVSDFTVNYGDKLALAGRVRADADLAGCLGTVARVAEWKETPKIAGKLTFDSACKTDGDRVEIKGNGQIPDLRVGENATPQALNFAVDSALDNAAGTLDVRDLKLASVPLTLDISGDVRNVTKSATLNLDGQYEIDWQPLTALIHELAPDTKQTVIINGKSASKFAVRGDANAKDKQPAYHDLTTGLDLSWDSARIYGVEVSNATLSPKLDDGVLALPVATMKASGGTLRLGGNVDLRGDEPTLRIKDDLTVLENVPLNKTVADVLLAIFNPVFANVTEMSGHASLRVKGIELPLGEKRNTGGAGTGRLDMIDVKMKPSGLLGQLITLGGLAEDLYAVEISGLDFNIDKGRIHYKDFTLLFAKSYDMKFYGSVGLDGTLDLVVSLPVRPALLRQLKVTGPIDEYAQMLEGLRVDIPIVGTRTNPRLDLAKVDVAALLKKAVSPEGLGNVLKKLGGG